MLSLIVAFDQNRVIGKDNKLPWHLPNDLQFFKRTTMGKAIIMGRNTFESIGKPLPGRNNIVLTRQQDYRPNGVEVIKDMDELKKLKETEEEHFIIGGAEVFNKTLSLIDKMYITYIDDSFEGDTLFPIFNNGEWELISETKGEKNEINPYDYYFRVYCRKR